MYILWKIILAEDTINKQQYKVYNKFKGFVIYTQGVMVSKYQWFCEL
jgi:hypothetical protein